MFSKNTKSKEKDPGFSQRKFLFLALSFTEGGAVMVTELVGARMLAPLYGSSLSVWGAILGVTLIALTIGYYVGGLLSQRKDKKAILYWCLAVAAFCIVLMPGLARSLMFSFGGLGIVGATLSLSCIYLLLPLVLLGAASPLIISIISSEVADSGTSAGTVYAVSTTGGILATFLSGFYLIPEFGLTVTAYSAGIILIILPLFLLLQKRQFGVLIFPAIFLFLMIPAKGEMDSSVKVLYRSEGLLGQLMVIDVPVKSRITGERSIHRVLYGNRIEQTRIDLQDGMSIGEYAKYITTISSVLPEKSRALLLGLGGGVIARDLQQLGIDVDIVELDPRSPMVAKQYFGLDPRANIHIDDGRRFLRTEQRKYDVIILDVFKGEVQPAHLLSVEAFKEAKGLLTPSGFIVINFNGFITGEVGYSGRSLLKTLEAAGFRVEILPTGAIEKDRNNIFVGATADIDFNKGRSVSLFGDEYRNITRDFIDKSRIDREDAIVFTDDRPILEKVNQEVANLWRINNSANTKKLFKMGVQLFE